MSDAVRLGLENEDKAAEYLRSIGYLLISRRFKTKSGEIDIIALDGDVLVFVEVKYRGNPGPTPESAVDRRKVARIDAAVREYYARNDNPPYMARYDLVAITKKELRHYKAAFRPGR